MRTAGTGSTLAGARSAHGGHRVHFSAQNSPCRVHKSAKSGTGGVFAEPKVDTAVGVRTLCGTESGHGRRCAHFLPAGKWTQRAAGTQTVPKLSLSCAQTGHLWTRRGCLRTDLCARRPPGPLLRGREVRTAGAGSTTTFASASRYAAGCSAGLGADSALALGAGSTCTDASAGCAGACSTGSTNSATGPATS